jgi:hypothetical protein
MGISLLAFLWHFDVRAARMTFLAKTIAKLANHMPFAASFATMPFAGCLLYVIRVVMGVMCSISCPGFLRTIHALLDVAVNVYF